MTTSTPPQVNTTPAPPVTQAAGPVTTTKADDTSPDHDKFIGRFAVGYLGLNDLPIAGVGGGGGGNLNLTTNRVAAPVIGARYWINRMVGIDAGIGLGLVGGSTEVVTAAGQSTTTDKASVFGLGIHGGVPLALAHGHHYSFLVVPEANIGFTSSTIKSTLPNTPDTDLSGFRLDVGGRIGAEIHFGFIGVPELSLQGSVGLYVVREAVKVKQGSASVSDGTTTFGTTVQADPWALFTKSISAFYYF